MKIKNNLLSAVSAIMCFYTGASFATEIATNAAVMQAMDKVTGRVNKITVPVNSKISYGDFSLVLRACKKRPAEEEPENFAFADVTDKSFGAEEYNIFRGWMLSSTPGLNAIEHPIYDIWLIECIDTEIEDKELLSEEELAKRDSLPTKKSIVEEMEKDTVAEKTEKDGDNQTQAIHIREFINEDRDIEKNLREIPAYIAETSAASVSDIEEGEEPENLLLFIKMQEAVKKQPEPIRDELSKAIDEEINNLQSNIN